jgi:putative colanic acid biosynthesis acetyltransferase WcaF
MRSPIHLIRHRALVPLSRKHQAGPYDSPWSRRERLAFAGWALTRMLLFRPTPKFLNGFRVWLLRIWGGRIHGRPFVSQSARIRIPWQLELHDRACIGERADVYNLGQVVIHEAATVAQESLLCGGTHDFTSPRLELMVGDITIGPNAFVGARACVLPGITIGEGCVVGAAAVVTRDTAPWTIVAGNPARTIGHRPSRVHDSGAAL